MLLRISKDCYCTIEDAKADLTYAVKEVEFLK